MKGYKVVQPWNDKLFSAVSFVRVEYKEGMFVHPEFDCGPLAVFSSLMSAKQFKTHTEEIWECEYRPSKGKILFYLTEKWGRREMHLKQTPWGTVFADSVKLIKKVSS